MQGKPINDCPVPNGTLLIIGGKEDRDGSQKNESSNPMELLKFFVSLINKANPDIAVITTASTEPDALFKDYVKAFHKLDVKNIHQIHHNQRADVLKDKSVKDRLNKADAIFFTGGNQLRLTTIYGGTELLFNLKQRYIQDRLLIAGTSAGAMAMSTPMIYAGNEDVQQISGEIRVTLGLEFLKDVCIDTHFVDRSRMVRMGQVLASNPTSIGLGLEEDTAVIVKNGLDVEVCGSGVVMLMDGTAISSSNILDFGSQSKLSIKGLKVDILSKGDSFVLPQYSPPHV